MNKTYYRKKTHLPNKVGVPSRILESQKPKTQNRKVSVIAFLITLSVLFSGFFYYQKTYSNYDSTTKIIQTDKNNKRTGKNGKLFGSISNLNSDSNTNKIKTNTNDSQNSQNSQKTEINEQKKALSSKITTQKAIFEERLATILNDSKTPDNYGIYLSSLSLDYSFGINQEKIFYPASISKLPIALLILQEVEKGKLKLTDQFELKETNKAYESDEMYSLDSGTFFPISTYLKKMVSQSDNTAMTTLEEILGGADKINLRAKNELGIANLSRYPQVGTAKDIGKLLENLYNNVYLNSQNTEYLVEMMVDVASWLQDRIPAGLPSGIETAHKVGQIETDNGVTFEDCGIIFGKKEDFVLVFVNQDIVQEEARLKAIAITKLAYSFFDE